MNEWRKWGCCAAAAAAAALFVADIVMSSGFVHTAPTEHRAASIASQNETHVDRRPRVDGTGVSTSSTCSTSFLIVMCFIVASYTAVLTMRHRFNEPFISRSLFRRRTCVCSQFICLLSVTIAHSAQHPTRFV